MIFKLHLYRQELGEVQVWSDCSDQTGAGKHLHLSTRCSFLPVTVCVTARTLLETCKNEREGNKHNSKLSPSHVENDPHILSISIHTTWGCPKIVWAHTGWLPWAYLEAWCPGYWMWGAHGLLWVEIWFITGAAAQSMCLHVRFLGSRKGGQSGAVRA